MTSLCAMEIGFVQAAKYLQSGGQFCLALKHFVSESLLSSFCMNGLTYIFDTERQF